MSEVRERGGVNGAGESWPWGHHRRSQKRKKVLRCDFTATVGDGGSAEVSAAVTLVHTERETLRERMVRARRGRERGHHRKFFRRRFCFLPLLHHRRSSEKPSLLVEPTMLVLVDLQNGEVQPPLGCGHRCGLSHSVSVARNPSP
ncbi:hypothetical protein PIB30_106055, partial [Stylosanthes scabra]|nr:hypothetical protein [Stylosanthes scabra]